jgi:periplasmic protein TonB
MRIARSLVLTASALLLAAIAAVTLPSASHSQSGSNEATQTSAQTLSASMLRYAYHLAWTLARSRSYPRDAASRGEQGTAIVAFTLDRDGHVLASHIVKSSGSASLDQAALDLVTQAQPFSPLPSDYPKAQADFNLPLRFVLPTAISPQ